MNTSCLSIFILISALSGVVQGGQSRLRKSHVDLTEANAGIWTANPNVGIRKLASSPGSIVADLSMPEVASMPGFSMPGFSMPGFSMPGFSMPGFSMPGFSMPPVVAQGGEEEAVSSSAPVASDLTSAPVATPVSVASAPTAAPVSTPLTPPAAPTTTTTTTPADDSTAATATGERNSPNAKKSRKGIYVGVGVGLGMAAVGVAAFVLHKRSVAASTAGSVSSVSF